MVAEPCHGIRSRSPFRLSRKVACMPHTLSCSHRTDVIRSLIVTSKSKIQQALEELTADEHRMCAFTEVGSSECVLSQR